MAAMIAAADQSKRHGILPEEARFHGEATFFL